MRIYVICPDHDQPSGGVRKLYRHVDVLNEAGLPACIVHQGRHFRCSWFENDTPIETYKRAMAHVAREPESVLVFPEIYGPALCEQAPGVRKVIFNQSGYYTFWGYGLDAGDLTTAYRSPDLAAVLVVSEDTRAYLHYAFPHLPMHRVHNGIDTGLFKPGGDKRRQIAYMPGKNDEDIAQVLNLLKFRGALQGWSLVPIAGQSQAHVAQMLRESLVFLNLAVQEGFGLPPAEAMACGCIVVGYDGMGGREFLRAPFGWPVPSKDVVRFAQTVEEVLRLQASEPQRLEAQAQAGAAFIRETYPLEREAGDIVSFWRGLLQVRAAD